MKYQESGIGKKSEFADFIKKTVPDLFGGRLAVEGHTVTLPVDLDLEYKIKYDTEETGGSFSIKVSWDTAVENEEEEVDVDTD